MYEFHYQYIKNKYDTKSKLLFTDTDSLMYEIKTKDVSDGFSSSKEMFCFINYLSKSKYYDDANKLVIDKINDEVGGVAIEEFVFMENKNVIILVR